MPEVLETTARQDFDAAMDIFGDSVIEEGTGEEDALSGDDLKAKGEEPLSVGKKEKPVDDPEEEIDEYSHLKETKKETKKEEVKPENKPAETVSEISAELLDRAKQAGIPLSVMRKFDDVEEAEYFVLRAEAVQVPKTAAAEEEPKPVSKPADGGEVKEEAFVPFDLSENLEEGETIDMYDKSIVKMVEHFNKQMELVFNRTGKAVEPEGFQDVKEYIKQEQSRKGEEIIDTHLLALADYKTVFGEGKWSSLSPNSSESKNRQAVVDEINDRIQVYKMNNRAMPSLEDLIKKSVAAVFPDIQVKAVEKELLNSIEKRKAQSLSRVQDTATDTDSKKRLAELDDALAQLQESFE